jgi:hypothetical protein
LARFGAYRVTEDEYPALLNQALQSQCDLV